MTIHAKVVDQFNPKYLSIIKHDTEFGGVRAAFMEEFIGRWGMVAAIPDGEDTAGRQKLRMATPAELVDRATSVTELAFDVMKEKGWVIDGPTIEQLTKAK